MAGHYLTASQWALPTAEHYAKMQAYANRSGGDFLRREYEELHREYEELRREYEELRREYEELRRPFDARKGPRTDVWDYPIVTAQERHHVAQKPVLMMAAMIEQSTRPGAVVLDSFMGSGSTGVACMMTGRRFLGIERDPEYLAIARARISQRRTRPRPIFSPPPRRQPPTAREVRPMLTPDQIKQFEARAEAGERPVMEWVNGQQSSTVILPGANGLSVTTRYTDRPNEWIFLGHGSEWSFRTMTAAQLAAEHLLREATAPLWQEAIDRLIRAAMAAQREEAKQ